MKNLIVYLLFFATALPLRANNYETTIVNKYEYVFLFVDREYNLTVHYEKGNEEVLATLQKNYISGNITKENIVKGFEYLTKGFHYLENKGYELVTTNHIPSQYGSEENPYFIFRRLSKRD